MDAFLVSYCQSSEVRHRVLLVQPLNVSAAYQRQACLGEQLRKLLGDKLVPGDGLGL